MPSNSYPVAADLLAYLASAGVTVDEVQAANAVTAGIAAFERDAGRVMLAPATPATRYFDPPFCGGLLDLGADVLAVSAVTYQPEGSPAEILAPGTDYRLGPENAAAKGQPWAWVYFRRNFPHGWAIGQSIAVTGRWGYGVAIPDDAWQAMLLAGALQVIQAGRAGSAATSGVVKRLQEGDNVIEYASEGSGGQEASSGGLTAMYQATVDRYRRGYL